MTRAEVIQRLAETRAELAGLGVRSLDLFGSVARGESGPDSDVDLLVDFDRPIGLFHFVRVQRRLEEILGCRVDLVMRDAVKRQLRDRIFAEAVRATYGEASPSAMRSRAPQARRYACVSSSAPSGGTYRTQTSRARVSSTRYALTRSWNGSRTFAPRL